MGHLSSDEVERNYVKSMGDVLGPVYNRLQSECTLLNSVWQQLLALFGTNEQRVEVLNWAAPYFFKVTLDVFFESTLLRICRMTDPPRSMGKPNLSLAQLPPLVDSQIRDEIASMVEGVRSSAEFARDWRNRHIAHHDFALSFDSSAKPLAPVTKKMVLDVIEGIGAILKVVERHYTDSETAFDRLIAVGQADDLLQLLNDGYVDEMDFRKKLESGKFTNADFEMKWRDKI